MRRAKHATAKRGIAQLLEPRRLLTTYTWPSGTAHNTTADDIQVQAATVNGVSGIQVIQYNLPTNTQFYPNITKLIIYLGDGSDDLIADNNSQVPLEIWGGNGHDSITSGAGNDTIYGEAGNDSIDGRNGADYIEGSSGMDYLRGGTYPDTILGGNDADTIYGVSPAPAGAAWTYWTDDDLLVGGDGNDFIDGNFGFDDITGSTGDDVMYLGHEGGIIQGGAGNDTCYGGEGVDNLIGNEGNDVFYTNDGIKDFQIRGGPDYDRLVLWDDPIDTQLGSDSQGRSRFEIDVFGPP